MGAILNTYLRNEGTGTISESNEKNYEMEPFDIRVESTFLTLPTLGRTRANKNLGINIPE